MGIQELPAMKELAPPTDNLYKFLAVSGLIVFIFCFVYPFQIYQDLVRQAAAGDQEVVALRAEDDSNNAAIKSAEAAGAASALPGKADASERLREKRDDIARRWTIARSRYQFALLRKEDLRVIFLWAIGYGTCGLMVSGTGFWLWYARLQQYQDMVAKADAEEALRRMREASEPRVHEPPTEPIASLALGEVPGSGP